MGVPIRTVPAQGYWPVENRIGLIWLKQNPAETVNKAEAATRANAEPAMCERCIELDRKVDHLKEVSGRVLDQQTLDGINGLIAKLEAEKRALHPERP